MALAKELPAHLDIVIRALPPSSQASSAELEKDLRSALQRVRKKLEKRDRKSTRLNSSHVSISYAVFCLKKKKRRRTTETRGRQQRTTHKTPCRPPHAHPRG